MQLNVPWEEPEIEESPLWPMTDDLRDMLDASGIDYECGIDMGGRRANRGSVTVVHTDAGRIMVEESTDPKEVGLYVMDALLPEQVMGGVVRGTRCRKVLHLSDEEEGIGHCTCERCGASVERRARYCWRCGVHFIEEAHDHEL